MARTNRLLLLGALMMAVAAPVVAQSYSEGFTFLKAVRERDGNTAERILSNPSSTAVNVRDSSTGEAALHILVRGRDASWLLFMLGHGARPDSQSNDGTTPLILAAQLGWYEGAQLLLGRNANPNLGNSRGETPLIFAVQRRDLPMVRLLLARRADPNQTDNNSGNSPIDYARQDNRATAILRLLEQAAAPRAPAPGPPRN
jgi:ankyrin repeat protein